MAKKDEIKNVVSIIGTLAELTVSQGVQKESGVAFLSVTGVVQYGTEDYETLEFNMYCPEFDKDGNPKKNYPKYVAFFNGIQEKKLTIADGNPDAKPIRLKVLAGFKDNYFWGEDGKFISNPKISSNYVVEATSKDKDGASFNLDCVIKSFKKEIANEEETGRLITDVYTWDFFGNVVPVEHLIIPEDMADDFEDVYEKGDMLNLAGSYVCRQVVKSVKAAVGKAEDRTYTIKEKILTYGQLPYEEENPKYEKKTHLQEALNERDMRIKSDKHNPECTDAIPTPSPTVTPAMATAMETKKDVASLF